MIIDIDQFIEKVKSDEDIKENHLHRFQLAREQKVDGTTCYVSGASYVKGYSNEITVYALAVECSTGSFLIRVLMKEVHPRNTEWYVIGFPWNQPAALSWIRDQPYIYSLVVANAAWKIGIETDKK